MANNRKWDILRSQKAKILPMANTSLFGGQIWPKRNWKALCHSSARAAVLTPQPNFEGAQKIDGKLEGHINFEWATETSLSKQTISNSKLHQRFLSPPAPLAVQKAKSFISFPISCLLECGFIWVNYLLSKYVAALMLRRKIITAHV